MNKQSTRLSGIRKVSRKTLVVCLVVCLNLVPALPKDKPEAIPRGNWGLVGSLTRGTSISVCMSSGDRIDGSFEALDVDSLRLVRDRKESVYPRNDVAEIWQLRVPDSKLNGVLLGMGAGAAAGAVGAAASNAPMRGEDAWGAAMVLAGIGLGAIVGATADALIKSDRLIYRK